MDPRLQSPRVLSRRAMLILGALLLVPVNASAWRIEADFESGTLGAKAEGADGFHGTAGHSYYSDLFVHSGSQSAQLNISEGDTGFGRWGGSFDYPDLHEGDEIWWRVWVYFPDDFDFSCGCTQGVKFMRIHTESANGASEGYHSILVNGDIETGTEVNDDEFRENNGARSDGHRRSGVQVERGRWLAFENYVRFSAISGQGIYRVWQDGTLVFEDEETATLRSATSRGDFLYLFTYWNNGAPKTQSAYIDDVVVTNEMPSNRDAEGNAFIGADMGSPPPGGGPDAGVGDPDAGVDDPGDRDGWMAEGPDREGPASDPVDDPAESPASRGCSAAGATPMVWFHLALMGAIALFLHARRRRG